MTGVSALVTEELVSRSHELVRSVQHHDVARLEGLLADEFTLDGAAGELGRAELLDAARSAYAIEDFAYDELDAEVLGNTAVVVSRYRQRARLGTEDASGLFRVTDVWVRRGGRWQIVRRHATPEG